MSTEQFSDASQYDIDIDWAYDATLNDIDFVIPRIQKLLFNINPNKACGTDGIRGRILKNCPNTLAQSHSIKKVQKMISRTSYQFRLLV